MTPEIEQIYNDLENTNKKLSNGHRGDPIVMSEGIVNIGKTLQVILKKNFITPEECEASHQALLDEITKRQFGWKKSATVITSVLIFSSTLFGLGIHIINTIAGG